MESTANEALTRLHELSYAVPPARPNTNDMGQAALESEKPTVIGLYGIPGSGKSFLMNDMKGKYWLGFYAFYETSEMIDSLVTGGIEAFQAMGEQQRADWRRRAIKEIKKDAIANNKIPIVNAQFMFWPEGQAVGQPVYTLSDLDIFTHIIYLNTPAECILQRRSVDKLKYQPAVSVQHLRKWQEAELIGLRHV